MNTPKPAMDESLRSQVETYLSQLDVLIRSGKRLRDALGGGRSDGPSDGPSNDPGNGPSRESAIAATRAWQQDCGVTINQLSGGSKAHWLARAFSDAFMVRSSAGHAVEGAAPDVIVQRLLDVLEQAVASLSQQDAAQIISASSQAPAPRRFEFVHNAELRPIIEQAYADSRRALDQGQYELALRTSCGILEAIVTDALEHKAIEHKGLSALAASGALGSGAQQEKIADWPFEKRLAVAEKTGLMRGGCARLPAVARTYRDASPDNDESGPRTAISERDARQTAQVLHVIMRDLDPGR